MTPRGRTVVEGTVRGQIENTETMRDFAATGPWLAQDLSRLSRVSAPSLMCFAAFARVTGLMSIRSQDGVHLIGLKDGAIISVEREGTIFLDEVTNHLVASGVVSPEIVAQAQAEAKAAGISVIQAFYEKGVCTPRDLVEAIRTTKQSCLERLLSVRSATFELTAMQRPPKAADPVAIDLNLFMVRYIREKTRTAYLVEFEPHLNPYMGRYPLKTDRLTPAILGVAFTEKERKTLTEVADGSITLKDVFALSLLGRVGTARLFLIAGLLGFIEYRMTPLPKGGIEVLEEELRRTLERMQADDHFTRLGIHWTTHPSKIEPAFQRMKERWGPEASVRKQSEKAAQLSEKIYALILESYEVLKQQDSRRAYRANLLGQAKLEFGTEFLYKQAHLARFRGELDKAREIIESAIDILPKKEFVDFRRGLG